VSYLASNHHLVSHIVHSYTGMGYIHSCNCGGKSVTEIVKRDNLEDGEDRSSMRADRAENLVFILYILYQLSYVRATDTFEKLPKGSY